MGFALFFLEFAVVSEDDELGEALFVVGDFALVGSLEVLDSGFHEFDGSGWRSSGGWRLGLLLVIIAACLVEGAVALVALVVARRAEAAGLVSVHVALRRVPALVAVL